MIFAAWAAKWRVPPAAIAESGGLWAWVALCATGALHYERRLSNALRRVARK